MKRMNVKQIFQQFLIAVVVFSLISPGSLWAKREKPGAWLIITKMYGQLLEGELLRVKQNSLLLMTFAARNGETVEISEVKSIKLEGKSKLGKSALSGALIFGSLGFAFGFALGLGIEGEEGVGVGLAFGGTLAGAGIGAGAIIGGIFGAVKSRHKTFHIKGKSPDKIKKILKILQEKARFKD